MYSATPGGDLHPISLTPQQVRICLCGHPFRPNIGGVRSGRTGNEQVMGLMEAAGKPIEIRKQMLELAKTTADESVSRGAFSESAGRLTTERLP